ncbi:hypothetical protein AB0F17_64140 [Nonomuraea sp. NPDC026600]|uniref:sodium:calcium antiporter n=1 Tax=Nonomuraea sp. NPDC026600 TaxID=3155363 RepID=UPI0033F119E0
MLLLIAEIVAGWTMLAFAADQLLVGSGRLAGRLGLRPAVVGVLVIACAAGTPEVIVAATSGLRGHGELATAALVGSNLVNVTLVLGVGGLMAGLAVRSWLLQREALLSVAAVTVFAILLLHGLGLGASIPLAAALAGALALLHHLARSAPADEVGIQATRYLRTDAPQRPGREVMRTLLGLAGVLSGAQLLVLGASGFSARTGASADLAGFTLVAFGLALPDLLFTLRAQRYDGGDLVIATLLGANLITSLAGGAIAALSTPQAPTLAPTLIIAMVAVSGTTWLLLAAGTPLGRPQSAILVMAYALLLLLSI